MLTYQQAAEKFARVRDPARGYVLCGRNNSTRLFKHNVSDSMGRVHELYAVRLHNTDVVTLHKSGTYTLNSGGWRTPTTKDRINTYGPVNISAVGGHWQVYRAPDWYSNPLALFKDGMRVTKTGKLIGAGGKLETKREDKLRAQVKAFCAEYIRRLYDGELPAPGGGDCWGCSMVNTDPAAKDQYPMGRDCVRGHIKEKYYFGSLIVRAFKAQGMGPAHMTNLGALFRIPEAGTGFSLESFRKDYTRALRRFCLQQCGLSA